MDKHNNCLQGSVGQEDTLQEGVATHSNILAWRIPWTEEPGRPQSIGSHSQTQLKQLSMHTHSRIKSIRYSVIMGSLEWKKCVLMLSNARSFPARLSRNLWGGLLPKLAPGSHFSWHPSAAFTSNAVEYCLLASGDKQRRPDGGTMSEGMFSDTEPGVAAGRVGVPPWPQVGTQPRGQEKWPGYTVCSEHTWAVFLLCHIPRLGNVDGTCVWLAALPGCFKALPKIF